MSNVISFRQYAEREQKEERPEANSWISVWADYNGRYCIEATGLYSGRSDLISLALASALTALLKMNSNV
ncbi:MAG: hypothetical protein ON057_001584 [Glomeribacter sp. 1016415]|nr:hypothetical protein [Glomeribacter sp. 1016415]